MKWLRNMMFLLLVFLPWCLSAQDSLSDTPLADGLGEVIKALENLQEDNSEVLSLNKDLQKELQAATQSVKDLKSISETQGIYLNGLTKERLEMQRIYTLQSNSYREYKKKSAIWKYGTIGFGVTTLIFGAIAIIQIAR